MNPPSPPNAGTAIERRTGHTVLLLSILVIAANLRPTITAYGSVVGVIGADTGLGPGALGVLGAVPLFAFAAVSPVVHLLTRRIGLDRAVLAATVVLVVGTLIRSLPGGSAPLWAGTAILGAAIAVGNVVIPAIVKRDFASEIPLVTGLYSAVLGGAAAFASGLALPIALRAGWRVGIGIWGLLSVVALVVWLVRLRRVPPDGRPADYAWPAGQGMWTSPVAWQVTLFMGTQATGFYLLVTWLPTIEVSFGRDPITAGWHSFVYQVVGIVAGLAITLVMRGRRDHRLVGVGISVLLIGAMGGLLAAPAWSVLWLALAGLSGGSSLVLALALIGERSRTAVDAGRLSGMAQSVGYLLAAAGPIGAGLLFEVTGSWTAPLVGVMVIGLIQLVVVLLAGRDRYTHPVACGGPVAQPQPALGSAPSAGGADPRAVRGFDLKGQ